MKGQAKPELLETYNADRVPVIENVLTKTEDLTDTIGSENRLFRSVFNHLAPWIVSIESVEHNSTEHMSQLANNYRDSPLSVSDGYFGSLHAGDRMPDLQVTLMNREGSTDQQPKPATIFELMDPSTFTLFYSHIDDPAKTHAEIQTAIGEWHYLIHGHQIAPPETGVDTFKKLFGNSPSIILARPDGYIAFTGTDNLFPSWGNTARSGWTRNPRQPKRKQPMLNETTAWDQLSSQTAQVLFCDLQKELVARSKTTEPKALHKAAGVLMQLAKLFSLPTTLSVVPEQEKTTGTDSGAAERRRPGEAAGIVQSFP